MFFVVLLFASAFAIAAAAGFFSIVGLATTYGGSFWAVAAMGATVEIGKLFAVSFLYRFWNLISIWFKTVLCTLIFGVMLITSLGVFGFLTKANQVDMVAANQQTTELINLTTEQTTLTDRKKVVDEQMFGFAGATLTANQMKLVRELQQEQTTINKRLSELRTKITTAQQTQVSQHAEIGPLMYVAKTLGYGVDVAVMGFTLLLVLVFDPLAITLTICANIALAHHRASNTRKSDNTQPQPQPQPQPVVERLTETVALQPTSPTQPIPQPTTQVDVEPIIVAEQIPQTPTEPIIESSTPTTSLDEQERVLLEADWNHYVAKNINTGSAKKVPQSKLDELLGYVAELDARPKLTDDEIILRNRIVNYVNRQLKKAET